jgi:hypothetical protein
MCTVTIVTGSDCEGDGPHHGTGGRVRLACNRDELRTRPLAYPPVIRKFGDRLAIMPIDPVSGGTWIAVNDAGFAATLLNVNTQPRSGPWRTARSRGVIIPALLQHESATSALEALEQVQRLDPGDFGPFRLVLLDESSVAEVRSDGANLVSDWAPLTQPLLFTSSGLGDQLVEGPRRGLFDALFADAAEPAEVQDRFHRHSWPDRLHLSVCMSRREAHTVNHTVVEIGGPFVRMTYVPHAPDRVGDRPPVELTVSRGVPAACPC